MLIDYKFRHTEEISDSETEVTMAIYSGAVTTEDELDLDGNIVSVTRYRRDPLLEEMTKVVSGKIPEQAAVKRCNKFLKDYANEHGHTVIMEQSGV